MKLCKSQQKRTRNRNKRHSLTSKTGHHMELGEISFDDQANLQIQSIQEDRQIDNGKRFSSLFQMSLQRKREQDTQTEGDEEEV